MQREGIRTVGEEIMCDVMRESEPYKEHQRLVARDVLLNALQRHGVDNWEGWDDAISDLTDEELDLI